MTAAASPLAALAPAAVPAGSVPGGTVVADAVDAPTNAIVAATPRTPRLRRRPRLVMVVMGRKSSPRAGSARSRGGVVSATARRTVGERSRGDGRGGRARRGSGRRGQVGDHRRPVLDDHLERARHLLRTSEADAVDDGGRRQLAE